MGSLINLYYYLNITFSAILSLSKPRINYIHHTINSIPLTISIIFLILIPLFIIYALTLFNKSQRYWHSIFYLRSMSRNNGCCHKTPNSNRAQTTRLISRKRSTIQHYCNRTCIPNNFLSGNTCIYWGIW